MNILSIQSHVAYGHVGNSAAVFALQRLGCEVWPIHTVLFSNHPGHGGFRGEIVGAGAVQLSGIAISTLADAAAAIETLAARGPRAILVTSVATHYGCLLRRSA